MQPLVMILFLRLLHLHLHLHLTLPSDQLMPVHLPSTRLLHLHLHLHLPLPSDQLMSQPSDQQLLPEPPLPHPLPMPWPQPRPTHRHWPPPTDKTLQTSDLLLPVQPPLHLLLPLSLTPLPSDLFQHHLH
jgi:hypothetical protein